MKSAKPVFVVAEIVGLIALGFLVVWVANSLLHVSAFWPVVIYILGSLSIRTAVVAARRHRGI